MPSDSVGAIEEAQREAAARWPAVRVRVGEFSDFVRRRATDCAALHLTDLYLACACLQGDAAALAVFETEVIGSVVPALSSRRLTRADIDDVLQKVRTKLLVNTDRPCGLTQYTGRGRLGGFVRTVAVRLALNHRRGSKRSIAELLDDGSPALIDPELERLKAKYLCEFRAALSEAWQTLDPEHRLHLSQQVFDGLSIDQIAAVHDIHRSTAARRLIAAKSALELATRHQLGKTLGIPESAIDSVLRLLHTRLNLAADALSP